MSARGTGPGGGTGAVHVVLCANRAYLPHAAVAIVSAAEATRSAPLHAHLFTCDAAVEGDGRLRDTLRRHPGVRFDVHVVDPAELVGLGGKAHVTNDAFLRFLAADLLPPEVRRAVYIDSDVVVLRDLSELAGTDLAGQPVGAVADIDWRSVAPDGHIDALGLSPHERYANSGVLVMDLDLWRREGLHRRIFAFARRHGDRLTYVDQDALNAVLRGRIAFLDRRWNVQAMMYGRTLRRVLPGEVAAFREALADPGILHFTTGEKPWTFRAFVRRKRVYYRFRAKTAWRSERPPLPHWSQRLEYDLTRMLLPVGIDLAALPAAARLLRGAKAPRPAPTVPHVAATRPSRP